MDYQELIKEEDKKLAVVAPTLYGTDEPGNQLQIQIQQDDQRAYIDLWLSEAIKLREKLDEWIKIKHDSNKRTEESYSQEL